MTAPNHRTLWPKGTLQFSLGSVRGEGGNVLSAFGEANFRTIREENMFYVDKTRFAADLLNFRRAVMLRPPRSGKTLFVDTVDCQFDVRFEDSSTISSAGFTSASTNQRWPTSSTW